MSDISRAYHSINIDDRNTWDYWHLIPTARPIVSPPEVKANLVEVPGRYGFIDLSTILTGRTMYGSRQGSWTFIAHPDYHDSEPWNVKYSDIMQFLHGKTHQVILDDDPFYYYEGFLKVNSWQPGANWSQVAIDYTLQPFKKETITSMEDWLWDPFSFVDGIIRSYKNVVINGDYTLNVDVGEEMIIPEFIVSDPGGSGQIPSTYNVYVSANGGPSHLVSGGETRSFSDVKLQGSGNVINFSGNGIISVNFRAGWL